MINKHTASFINMIAEEGTKNDAVEQLQQTWDDLINLRMALLKRGYTLRQIRIAEENGSFE